MKKLIKYLVIVTVWIVPSFCWGQATISNVNFAWQSEEERVIISYYLQLNASNKLADVSVYMSLDGGRTYRRLANVSGDVGTVRTSGNKQVVFDIFRELGKEEISGNVQFRIEGIDDYKPRNGPYNAIFSVFVPGLGDHRVTGGKENGLNKTLWTYGLIATGVGCKYYSNNQYEKYRIATVQDDIDTYYDRANVSNQLFYICVGTAAIVWVSDIIWVWNKGAQNRRENRSNLSFYYTPEFNATSLSLTIKF